MAEVLGELGSERAMVVHGADGMDEITIGASTITAELNNGKVTSKTIDPEQFGISKTDVGALKVNSAAESFSVVKDVLANKEGPARDIVALNSGAAIYIAGIANTHEQGVKKALEIIANGSAAKKLDALVECSNSL